MKKTALILEGGALRSLFTSGVLDVFMEHDIYFPTVCGVSAGSLCAVSYLSKQIGRNAELNIGYVNDKRYLGLHSLIHDKMIFNFDFMFGELSHTLVPLDYETFYASKQKLVAFTTDVATGESVTFENDNDCDILLACRASSSMPMLSKNVEIDGREYVDGGVSASIPYKWALDRGYEKIVIILTRDINYRKKPTSGLMKSLYRKCYKDNPQLVEKMTDAPERYNQYVEEIIELEKSGRIFVIRPEEEVKVSRTEKDTKKLRALYNTGREIGEKQLENMLAYLNS